MTNPWFRLYNETVDDDKLRLLAFEDRWHYIAILCCKNSGLLEGQGDLMRRRMAVKMGLTVRELEEVVRRLSEVNLINYETMEPCGWDKRQFKSDYSTERVKNWRKNKELDYGNGNETLQKRCSNGVRIQKQIQNKKKEKPTFVLPEWISPSLWDDFVAMRKAIKKPLTDRAKIIAIGKLRAFKANGFSPDAVLEQSILNSWSGLWPPKVATPQESTADQKRTAEWTELLS